GVTALEVHEHGEGGVPLVLLHGFAASHRYWEPVLDRLLGNPVVGGRHVLAYDLPGHGASAPSPTGRTAQSANLLLADLARRNIGQVHLAGHSMGGAIACHMALKAPSRVASLTLLAPGGFGQEINAKLIRRFAAASERGLLAALYEQFYGWRRAPSDIALGTVLADHARPGACAEYARIAETFLEGDRQGVLPLDAIAALGMPIKVIWGTQDRITPTRQAHKLPGEIAVHVFEGVGHSIADEIPDVVVRLIGENVR
ncbi:MAG: alpha/beta fold hydrolase, partial [Pseudomonadota bacterium]|nr:alpha/beta fold hydrolase [Pseudomonadota bacterium]